MAIGFIKKVFTFGKGKPDEGKSGDNQPADPGSVAIPAEVEAPGSDPSDVAALLGRPMQTADAERGPEPTAAPDIQPVLPEEIDTAAGPAPDIDDETARAMGAASSAHEAGAALPAGDADAALPAGDAGAASPPSDPSGHLPLKGGDRERAATAVPNSAAEAAEAKHPDTPLPTSTPEIGEQASPEPISPLEVGSEGRVETRGSTQQSGRTEGGRPQTATSDSIHPQPEQPADIPQAAVNETARAADVASSANEADAAALPSDPSGHLPLKGGDRESAATAVPNSSAEAAEAKHPDVPLSTSTSEIGEKASPELISPLEVGSEGRVETRGSTLQSGRTEGGRPQTATSDATDGPSTSPTPVPTTEDRQDAAASLPPPVGGMAGRPGGDQPHPQPQQPADISHGHIDTAAEAPPALPKGFASRSAAPVAPQAPAPAVQQNWFQRLKAGLYRTSSQLSGQITALFTKRKLDEDTLQELEDLLIQADLGVETAMRISDTLSAERYGKDVTGEDVSKIMATEITKVLKPVARPLELDLSHKPHVILVVGVNGTGKTTTIGKLAAKLSGSGLKVMLAAGDTFRAAAIEQLKIWADRTGSGFLGTKLGADAAGLAFEAFKQAQAEKSDVLIIDTAGRLQNKTELMAELEKIVRVLGKLDPDAPHTVLQTLDATTGQNAMNQVEIFRNVAGVSGLIMTKLDGTARGGILVAIAAKHKLPVYFIGVGEGVDDLEPFEAEDFAEAIAGIPH